MIYLEVFYLYGRHYMCIGLRCDVAIILNANTISPGHKLQGLQFPVFAEQPRFYVVSHPRIRPFSESEIVFLSLEQLDIILGLSGLSTSSSEWRSHHGLGRVCGGVIASENKTV